MSDIFGISYENRKITARKLRKSKKPLRKFPKIAVYKNLFAKKSENFPEKNAAAQIYENYVRKFTKIMLEPQGPFPFWNETAEGLQL